MQKRPTFISPTFISPTTTESWFVIEWEGEDGNYSPCPLKAIVTPEDPSEGDQVQVKEGNNIYNGVVLKKGIQL